MLHKHKGHKTIDSVTHTQGRQNSWYSVTHTQGRQNSWYSFTQDTLKLEYQASRPIVLV